MTDTAFAIYLLIAYSWVVGWIIACGQHYDACRAAGKRRRRGYFILFFTWPHYLGIK